jgi:hypothetical protein
MASYLPEVPLVVATEARSTASARVAVTRIVSSLGVFPVRVLLVTAVVESEATETLLR